MLQHCPLPLTPLPTQAWTHPCARPWLARVSRDLQTCPGSCTVRSHGLPTLIYCSAFTPTSLPPLSTPCPRLHPEMQLTALGGLALTEVLCPRRRETPPGTPVAAALDQLLCSGRLPPPAALSTVTRHQDRRAPEVAVAESHAPSHGTLPPGTCYGLTRLHLAAEKTGSGQRRNRPWVTLRVRRDCTLSALRVQALPHSAYSRECPRRAQSRPCCLPPRR